MNFKFVVQARLGSERLPGKVLLKIGGRPLLSHIIYRFSQVKSDNTSLVFAIAEEEGHEKLSQFLQGEGASVIAGDVDNVLSRYLEAAGQMAEDDYVVRLTGDNPFIDVASWPDLKTLLEARQPDLAYLKTVPLGMGYEAIKVKALRQQLQGTLEKRHFEHVSLYMKEKRESFSFAFFEVLPHDITWQVRLTVDTSKDLAMADKVANHFGSKVFDSRDVYRLYQAEPDFFSLNQGVKQKKV